MQDDKEVDRSQDQSSDNPTPQYQEPQTDQVDQPDSQYLPAEPVFSWSAKEYLDHKKTSIWLIVAIIAVALIATGVYFFTHGIFASVIVGIMGLVCIIAAFHKPKDITYQVFNKGISVGSRYFPFDDLKSFSIIEEKQGGSITFEPLKRFSPGASVFFNKEDEQDIINVLSNYLPNKQVGLDFIDRLMRSLRF